jgi:hypothetical protein
MRHLVVVLSVLSATSCATIHDEGSVPVFGRAVADAPPCEVTILRGDTPAGQAVGTRQLEGSVFLDAVEAERLLRREACAAGADAVHIAHEAYAVPFFGTQVVATRVVAQGGGAAVLRAWRITCCSGEACRPGFSSSRCSLVDARSPPPWSQWRHRRSAMALRSMRRNARAAMGRLLAEASGTRSCR